MTPEIYQSNREWALREDPMRAIGGLMWEKETYELSDDEVEAYLTGLEMKGIDIQEAREKVHSINEIIGRNPAYLFLVGKFLEENGVLGRLLKPKEPFAKVVIERFFSQPDDPENVILARVGPILREGIRPGLLVELLGSEYSMGENEARELLEGCFPAVERVGDRDCYRLHPRIADLMEYWPQPPLRWEERDILSQAIAWYEERLEEKGTVGVAEDEETLQLQEE